MRITRKINHGWQFTKEGQTQTVDLPHTWNGHDGQDGGNDYYRGTCIYEKSLRREEFPDGEEIYLQLDGANASASVTFNGAKLATHDGGYSTFRVKLENLQEENLLHIEVDNSVNETVYPQQADFTFYGGIYRDVSLIGLPDRHFDMMFHGAPGLLVTPQARSNGKDYEVRLQAFCAGDGFAAEPPAGGEQKTDSPSSGKEGRAAGGQEPAGAVVHFAVYDGDALIAESDAQGRNPEAVLLIPEAHLWNGKKDPHLYTAVATLLPARQAETGGTPEVLDAISLRFGCRSFRMDPDRGFLLNGEEYPLRGVSRHQDRPEIGNALLPEHHRQDIDLILEMGANSIRLAHYQHAQLFYDLCDEKGLVVWAEIPYISRHMPGGVENTRQQMTELIYQNTHHACIVTWGLSNEITMGQVTDGLMDNHKMLNNLVHELDPSRPTTLAVLTTCSIKEPYIHISDILAYNQYFGWYGGRVTDYGPWFDDYHQKYPQSPIGISEYGCEALNWHSSNPEQGDYTEEYQAYYHEEVIKQIMDRPYLWATYVWNMFDFAADSRSEGGENGMNHKGLVTFDRSYRKDSFYAYQAWLSDQPMLHICGKRYVDRVEELTKVKIYTNQDSVELFANGASLGRREKGRYPFYEFEVPNAGETTLTAKAGDLTDESVIRKVDTFNEAYRLKEEGAVLNWFDITAPEGYYSLNDTIGDIVSTLRGKLFFAKTLRMIMKVLKTQEAQREKENGAAGGEKRSNTINKTTISIAMGFTVKRALSMIGVKLTKEQLLNLNAQLNKIRKPRKS